VGFTDERQPVLLGPVGTCATTVLSYIQMSPLITPSY